MSWASTCWVGRKEGERSEVGRRRRVRKMRKSTFLGGSLFSHDCAAAGAWGAGAGTEET